MLQIRGKNQFRSPIGRALFREIRAQILILCLWDDSEPPAFLWEWNTKLKMHSPYMHVIAPADDLTMISFEFAALRPRIRSNCITPSEALKAVMQIDLRLMQWSQDTMNPRDNWHYRDLEVPESIHVWNGIVHAYGSHPAPSVWNTYRSVRIMVTRTQEQLCQPVGLARE